MSSLHSPDNRAHLWDVAELAYLAGILDGEGILTVYAYEGARGAKRRAPRYVEVVGVSTTAPCLTEWLHAHFGGRVYHRPPSKQSPHHKDKYDWRPNQSEIARILPAVSPYLVIKREQAALLIQFRATLARADQRWTGNCVPLAVLERRAQICHDLARMHRARQDEAQPPGH